MQFNFCATTPMHISLVAKIAFTEKMPEAVDPVVTGGAAAARFKAKAGDLFETFVQSDGALVRAVLAGAGNQNGSNARADLERAGAALAAKYICSGEREMVLDLSASGLDGADAAAVLLGFRLRAWRHDAYRTKLSDAQKISLETVHVVAHSADTEAAWADAQALAEGVEFTRHLVAEPANILYPESFVARCEEQFAGTGAVLKVLDEAEMTALGMGALLGVGQGSARESRVLAISWHGGGDEAPLALVGKGVTFDTGGISLKPGPGMGDMKWDMGGAGAVVGGMLALVKRQVKANIVGIVGLVENMPDGTAQRPGDIVTSMSGQTIEVLNTDAEGRLVLCDVLHWTQKEFRPARIVDFATLTGAMIISLGSEHGGLFANNDDLANDLLNAGTQSGDKLWRFPLSPAYDKLIDSPIADMQNIGPRDAGSITAAQFLKRFILDDTPWAHCDIAGMVWASKPGATWDKGATGYGVRLIDQLVRNTLES